MGGVEEGKEKGRACRVSVATYAMYGRCMGYSCGSYWARAAFHIGLF